MQGLWLKKPEPESILYFGRQLLLGEMATGSQLYVWKRHNYVHQWTARAFETGVSNNKNAENRAPVISYEGYVFDEINHLKYENQTMLLKGSPEYNAYEKDIAVLNLYFGHSTVFGIIQSSFLI